MKKILTSTNKIKRTKGPLRAEETDYRSTGGPRSKVFKCFSSDETLFAFSANGITLKSGLATLG
jgi:hypothetical protein